MTENRERPKDLPEAVDLKIAVQKHLVAKKHGHGNPEQTILELARKALSFLDNGGTDQGLRKHLSGE